MSNSGSPTIYVGNLPSNLDEVTLSSYFLPFGDIISISVPCTTTPAGKRNKGFGFITFSNPEEALDALDNMDLNSINGRTINVNLADPNKVKDAPGGGGMGGRGRAVWDSEEWLKQHAANEENTAEATTQEEQQT
ncbi:hypothetical protein NDA11_003841 [Ustilago hordei]|uniref:Related to ribonucleoprotein n=1 Tax=Ustilago hordei TaxID=120017 RepID=I2FYE1_USTHO|nr:uncharacterized protein UHO2_04004 [Ustilago hordei]KAJ1037301.1 hypothetical protein NDA10_004738 [Ustilago hordei]KAJ1579868.1 hypothetical protein NDA15_001230 [Ustilago hordei]KAJ1581889.1 hypothetical protein NDA12_004595 [Ustilago hordei]KAJ1582459.1 hypothetical protein NDA11_003841 [Ustilago hordei]KAJ1600284.1 hypothetical protein NDA14_005187 [Ustilago hordei]